jgi:PAS domain S-box-containing protein/putative nucleotidyltransferase with HDIG domain
MITAILLASTLLQLIAAVYALRLIGITKKWIGWMAIALAIFFMAARRSITLFRLLSAETSIPPDPVAEIVALVISVLMLAGIIWIGPLFASMDANRVSLRKSNRALAALSECNQTIIRIEDESELMHEICRIIVETGGYRMAWVGFAQQDVDKSVRPAAQWGFEDGYLEKANITWADTERGHGPTGTAIRSGKPSIARDTQNDPRFRPWREAALARGYSSSIALPVKVNGTIKGALNIYAVEPDAFDEEEIKLLTELAGDLSYALGNLRSRAERHRAEEERRLSEERYIMLFETMQEGFGLHEIICNEHGHPVDYRFLDVNPAFEKQTGLRGAEIVGRTVREVIPEIEEEWIDTYGKVALEREPVEFEMYSRSLGRHYAVEAFSPAEGKFATVFHDITELKLAEDALRASEELYYGITEQSLVGVYLIQDGLFKYVNPAFASIFGYERDELIGKLGPGQLAHEEDRDTVETNIQHRLRGEIDAIRYELRGVRKDGSRIHCEVMGRRVEYQGNPAIIGALVDITERKRHEKAVERQVERLKALREIDLAITGSLDPRLTFNILLAQVTQRMSVDAADILVFDHHTQRLKFAAGSGFHTDALQFTNLKMGEGYAGQAALERRIVHIADMKGAEDGLRNSPLLGQENFASYFAVPLISKGMVRGVMEVFHRAPLAPTQDWLEFLETLAGQAAIAIDNSMLFDELRLANVDLMHAYDSTLEGWALALELRDMETEGHSQRVTELTVRLARNLGIRESNLPHVRRGALLHDIGKMGIPDSILLKPGPLNEEEWEIMRQHPVHAYEMLRHIDYLKPALEIPYCHHEKWDGSGYPRGLNGEDIPLPARIFAVVDVWDALLSDRPYRKAWPEEKVLDYLRQQSGKHFDPKVLEAFLAMAKDIPRPSPS